MAADMNRTRQQQFTGRRPAPATGAPAPLSPAAAHSDQLDNAQFEKQALELAKATTVRPALIAADEVNKIRDGYSTGSGRLNVLHKVTDTRNTLWEEKRGEKPFDVLSDGDRAKAEAFFQVHGARLLGEQRQAPPNPIRREPPAPVPAAAVPAESSVPAAAAPDPAAGGAARPAPDVPGAARGMVPMPPPATLKIEYLSEQGFHCELTLNASSSTMVLEQGGAAMLKLLGLKARPIPPAGPAVVVQPPAPAAAKGESVGGDVPVCPIHKKQMKENRFKWFCPEKDEQQESGFCAYEVPKKKR